MSRIAAASAFFSSATVYSEAQYLPLDKDHPVATTNPYDRTKAVAEEVIRDWVRMTPGTPAVRLSYLDPVGVHESGWIGENPQSTPNNLMPFVAQVG